MNHKALNLLGLAQRAGKVVSGYEQVIHAIQNGYAKQVIAAYDLSSNSKVKLESQCEHYKVPLIFMFNKTEISQALGKSRSICCFIDQGFAKKWQQYDL